MTGAGRRSANLPWPRALIWGSPDAHVDSGDTCAEAHPDFQNVGRDSKLLFHLPSA